MVRRRNVLLLAAWCGACATSRPAPVPPQIAVELRAEEITPDLDATRLLRVRFVGGFWSHAQQVGVFWSDGTLEVEQTDDGRTRQVNTRLKPGDLQRLKSEMPALDLCFEQPEPCGQEDATDSHSVIYLAYQGKWSGKELHHYGGSTHTPQAFEAYERFLLSLFPKRR